jgi:hypothetical protein
VDSRSSLDSCSRFVPEEHSYLENEARHLPEVGIGHKLATLRNKGEYSFRTNIDCTTVFQVLILCRFLSADIYVSGEHTASSFRVEGIGPSRVKPISSIYLDKFLQPEAEGSAFLQNVSVNLLM